MGAVAPAGGATQQFGSFFNRPLTELLAFQGTDAEYYAACGLDVLPILEAAEAHAGGPSWMSSWGTWDWAVRSSGFVFVNHGAFGAALPPLLGVLRYFTELQQAQPLVFFDRTLFPLLALSVRRLKRYLTCGPHQLLLFPSATYALNCLLRGITAPARARRRTCVAFTTTYGAVKKMAAHFFGEQDVILLDVPMATASAWQDQRDITAWLADKLRCLCAGPEGLGVRDVTLLLEAVSSNSAIKWPYAAMAATAKEILPSCYVVVDAAHELGMSLPPPNMQEAMQHIDAWATNGHKWFSCPSGVGMLVLREGQTEVTEPLIVSHASDGRQPLEAAVLWHGHTSYAAWLTIPWAVDFWETESGPLSAHLSRLGADAEKLLCDRWGVAPALRPATTATQLRLVPLPEGVAVAFGSPSELQNVLHQRYRVEVPVKQLDSRFYVRISVFIYNTLSDYARLADAVLDLCGSAKL